MDASKEIKSMKLCKLNILPVFDRFDYTEMCKRNVFLRLAKKIEEKQAVKLTSSAVEEYVDRNENQHKVDH